MIVGRALTIAVGVTDESRIFGDTLDPEVELEAWRGGGSLGSQPYLSSS